MRITRPFLSFSGQNTLPVSLRDSSSCQRPSLAPPRWQDIEYDAIKTLARRPGSIFARYFFCVVSGASLSAGDGIVDVNWYPAITATNDAYGSEWDGDMSGNICVGGWALYGVRGKTCWLFLCFGSCSFVFVFWGFGFVLRRDELLFCNVLRGDFMCFIGGIAN